MGSWFPPLNTGKSTSLVSLASLSSLPFAKNLYISCKNIGMNLSLSTSPFFIGILKLLLFFPFPLVLLLSLLLPSLLSPPSSPPLIKKFKSVKALLAFGLLPSGFFPVFFEDELLLLFLLWPFEL